MFINATALVVDDSYATSQLINQILRHELNFGNVLVATNGKQALDYFNKQQVDWIFSDIAIPEMDGLALLTTLREHSRGKNIPFIIMSALTDKETIAKAMGAGATDFIAKPFNTASIIEKVQRIGQKPTVGDTAARQRRRVTRIKLGKSLPCQIVFTPELKYPSEMINLSLTGCMLRTQPFNRGGTIYDPAQLSLETNGKILNIKAILRRMQAEKKRDEANSAMEVMAGFQFIGLDAATLGEVKALITRNV